MAAASKEGNSTRRRWTVRELRPPVSEGGRQQTELGWRLPDLEAYLDANQARGGGGFIQRRVLTRGELPQLLILMGQGEGEARHLVASEVTALYRDQVLPERIEQRI